MNKISLVILVTALSASPTYATEYPDPSSMLIPKPKGCCCFPGVLGIFGDQYGTPFELKYEQAKYETLPPSWQKWYMRLGDHIRTQFTHQSRRAEDADERLVACSINFTVTFDGQIADLEIEGSPSEQFQEMIKNTVQNLKGNSILHFPNEAVCQNATSPKLMKVSGLFSQNFGPRYIKKKDLKN